MRFFCLFLSLFFWVSSSLAATQEQPAYRKTVASANFPGSEGFSLRFEPDEQLCKKHYGNRWRVKCAIPMGQPGQTAKGIVMTPGAKGYWEWQTANSLIFRPANARSIKPDTTYEINVQGMPMPLAVRLDQHKASLRTLPLAARLLESSFLIDPAKQGVHRLAQAYQFNFPVDQNEYAPSLQMPAESHAGNAELVWNSDRDKLNISWPVRKLAKSAGTAKTIFPHLGQISETDNGLVYKPAGATGATFLQNLPGARDIFKINSLNLAQQFSDKLDRQYVLELQTSLHVKAKNVQDKLRILELPLFNSKEATIPYNWSAAPGIPKDIVARSREIRPVPLQQPDAVQSRFKFIVPIQTGRHILAILEPGLVADSGVKMRASWHGIAQAPKDGGQAGFMQPGHILAGSGVLDIYGIDLDAINWTAQLARKPFLALLASGSSQAFEEPLDNLNLGMDNIAESAKGIIQLPKSKPGEAQYATLNLAEALRKIHGSPSGIALVTLRGVKDGKEQGFAKKVVLASNLGMIVKRGVTDKLDCFAQNLESGKPAANAKISILGANGKPLATVEANAQGHAVLPAFAHMSGESRPVAAIAEQNDALAWLPLQDSSRELNLSDFAIGGSHVAPDGIQAFVFSQRGMYRPGETMYFGALPRKADFSLLPPDLPLYAELLDPRGVTVMEKTFSPGVNGLAELAMVLPQDSLSGRYLFNVRNARHGLVLGSCETRVENFQPETLRLKLDAPVLQGWLVGNPQSLPDIAAHLQNLYGTPAANHKIKGKIYTAPANFRFAGFEDWHFTDAAPFLGSGVNLPLPEMRTDQHGTAKLVLPAELAGATSARVTCLVEGFDAFGGRGTASNVSFLISPMTQILGWRPAASLANADFIPVNSEAEIELISLNSSLNPTALDNLKLTLLRRNFVTSLIADGQGGFRYDDIPQELVINSRNANLPAAGSIIGLQTEMPGDFLLEVKDQAGRLLARIPYTVVGDKLLDANAPLAGSKMRIKLDKKDYSSGDEIAISLTTPYAAHGILTLEREGVHAYTWFEAHPGENLAKIHIPESFEGRGHIVATLLRDKDSKAIYMTPLAHAAAPFTANIAKRDLNLLLEAPKQAEPGGTLPVKLSANAKGQAILYAVDEGVLQLSAYATPKPLYELLGNRALDVTTIQAADLLMPEHGRIASRIAAFGGGADGAPFGAKFQNPFKRRKEPPLTMWSGIVEIGPDPREIQIPVPAWYSGNIRIMAVASSQQAAGACEAFANIAGPVVLTPQLPLAVAPGDEFGGALIIANTTAEPIKLQLSMKTARSLAIQIDLPKQQTLEKNGEIALPFSLKALGQPGEATIAFTAGAGNKTYTRDISLSVRPASTLRTTIQAGIAQKAQLLPKSRPVYAEHGSSQAMVSALPLPLAASLGNYLQTYPHGCTEQLTSRAFAVAFLHDWINLDPSDKNNRQKLLQAAEAAISSRFQEGRGVALWPQGEPDLLVTAYAADYLLSLRELGLPVNALLLERLCDALSWNCALNEPTLQAARASAYAIWVLAREGRIVTQLLEELRDSIEQKGIANWESDITAPLITAAMLEMHMPVNLASNRLALNADGWFDEYAQISLYLTTKAKYAPETIKPAEREDFFQSTAITLNQNAFSTFSAAQGIRALLALATAAPGSVNATLMCEDAPESGLTDLLANESILRTTANHCSQYRLNFQPGSLPLFWQVSTTGYDLPGSSKRLSQGLEIEREYINQDGKPVDKARTGEELTVRIIVRAQKNEIKDCVISDLLPGGLEMVIPRKGSEQLPKGIKYLDRQEDRMLVFADLTNQPLEIRYKVRAVSPGKFAAPTPVIEAMYDRFMQGQGASSSLEICH